MRDRIPVNKRMIPYRFDILLGSEAFTLEFHYNVAAGLFTVTTYKRGELICANEPLIYGVPLWTDCYLVRQFPCLTIVPLDESGQTDSVTWDNFGQTVFLTIDD